jgi:hypothetical protein
MYISMNEYETQNRVLVRARNVISYARESLQEGCKGWGFREAYFAHCEFCGENFSFRDAKVVHDAEEPKWTVVCHNCLNKIMDDAKRIRPIQEAPDDNE